MHLDGAYSGQDVGSGVEDGLVGVDGVEGAEGVTGGTGSVVDVASEMKTSVQFPAGSVAKPLGQGVLVAMFVHFPISASQSVPEGHAMPVEEVGGVLEILTQCPLSSRYCRSGQ